MKPGGDGLVGLVWAPCWVAQLLQGGWRARGERLREQGLTSGGQFVHVDQVPCPAGLLLWVEGAGCGVGCFCWRPLRGGTGDGPL